MSDRPSCEEARAIAPELALGIAPGDERARALVHLAGCDECRRYVEELSTVADELLLVAPDHEPPPGFESRVLAGMHPPRERAARRRRPLIPMFAAASAALATAVGLWLAVHGELDVANRYQDTLAVAHGEYLSAAELTAPNGRRAGTAFGYQGEPSWVLVTVYESPQLEPGLYSVEVTTKEGRHQRLSPIRIARGGGASGSAISVPVDDVTEVRLHGPGHWDQLRAEF